MDVGKSGLQALRERAEPDRAGSHPGKFRIQLWKHKMPFLLEAVEPHKAQTLIEFAVPQLCPLRLATKPLPGPLPSPQAFTDLWSLLFTGISEFPSCARRDSLTFFTKAGACQLLSCISWEHTRGGCREGCRICTNRWRFSCLCF